MPYLPECPEQRHLLRKTGVLDAGGRDFLSKRCQYPLRITNEKCMTCISQPVITEPGEQMMRHMFHVENTRIARSSGQPLKKERLLEIAGLLLKHVVAPRMICSGAVQPQGVQRLIPDPHIGPALPRSHHGCRDISRS